MAFRGRRGRSAAPPAPKQALKVARSRNDDADKLIRQLTGPTAQPITVTPQSESPVARETELPAVTTSSR